MPRAEARFVEELLPNGLRVAFWERPAATCSLQLSVAAGASRETAPMHGVTHVLEHLLLQSLCADACDLLGSWEGFTGVDDLFIRADVPAADVAAAAWHLVRLLHAEVTADGLRAARHQVLNEYAVGGSRQRANRKRICQAWWGADWYHLWPAGTPRRVRRLGLEDVRDWMGRVVVPANACLTMVGPVSPALEALGATAAAGDGRGAPAPYPIARGPARYDVFTACEAGPQTYLTLAFPAVPLEHPQHLAARLLGSALFETECEGTLMHRLRSRSPYVYNWQYRYQASSQAGYLTFECWVPSRSLDAVLRTVYGWIARVVEDGLSERELRAAMMQMRVYALSSQDAPHETIAAFEGQYALGRIGEPLSALEAIGRETVDAAARDLLRQTPLLFVWGPHQRVEVPPPEGLWR